MADGRHSGATPRTIDVELEVEKTVEVVVVVLV